MSSDVQSIDASIVCCPMHGALSRTTSITSCRSVTAAQPPRITLPYACFECNLGKGANIGAFDPLTGQLIRLYHPRLDQWQAHFTADDGQILGVDAIGRATASLLRFNQTLRVHQRRLLIAANRFPLPDE